MSLRINIWPMILLFAVMAQGACGSRKKSSPPPAASERGEGLGSPEGVEPGGEAEAPPPLVLTESERRHCLETQEKTLESWGWDRGRGVAGVIDILLDETQQTSPLPLCTP